jgi:hypothetical protein
VSVHTTHPHDTPGCDFGAEELLAQVGLGGALENAAFNREAISRAAEALRESLKKAQTVNQVGLGAAVVEKVASAAFSAPTAGENCALQFLERRRSDRG